MLGNAIPPSNKIEVGKTDRLTNLKMAVRLGLILAPKFQLAFAAVEMILAQFSPAPFLHYIMEAYTPSTPCVFL